MPTKTDLIRLLIMTSILLLSSACASISGESQKNGSSSVDGLPRLSPEEQGLDGAVLAEMEAEVEKRYRLTSGIVVLRNGELVYELYRGKQGADTLMEIYSVTKSVTSILTGIAIAEGAIDGLDTKLASFLPEYFASSAESNVDPRSEEITVEHLLTMSSGLRSSWSLEGSPINSYRGDLYQRAGDLGQTHDPGEHSQYSTIVSNLLAGIITEATGQDLEAYAAEKLFEPLGIDSWDWYHDDEGRATAGAGLLLRTRDMAKIGQLMLNNGMWNGTQIVPAEWIATSTNPHVELELWSGGSYGYGYLWWIEEGTGEEPTMYFGHGYAGQFIIIVPELDLVVATSSGCCMSPDQGWNVRKLVKDYVIPAAR